MKRTVVFGILLCLALSAPRARADESFTLQIPLRFNANQETGEVRVVLGLDGAPAGSHLVVGGNTILNLGDTQTIGGDVVSFSAGTGNTVRIRYRPLSNFAGDFCLGAAATEKNVALRFTGPQDVTDYRLSTFVVAAPAFECSEVSKRTTEAPATILLTGDGVAPALVAEDRGRLPLDVVLVLDKSGSMSEPPPEATSTMTSKITILKSALEAFVANWQEIDAPVPGAGDWSEDRLALVFFDTTAVAQTLPGADAPANVFLRRGPADAWGTLVPTIHALTTGGSTSLGGGLNEGMSRWKTDPLNDATLLLVTDGKQNTAPLVEAVAGGSVLGLPPVGGLPQELRKRFIPVQTIAFGVPASVDDSLLRQISLQTAGRSYQAVSAVTMFNNFAMQLVGILKGNTASLAIQRNATFSGSTMQELPVLVDASAQRVVFSLQWAPPGEHLLELEAVRPDGTVATPDSSRKPPQADLITFNIRRKEDRGTWRVRVKRDDRGHGDSSAPVPFNLNVFFLEKHLDYRLSFEQGTAGAGDGITVRANVTYDGKPLTGLPPNAIRVHIRRPGEGLGNILHASKIDVGSGATRSPGGDVQSPDVQSPYDRKLAALAGGDLLGRLAGRDAATISLTEAGHGLYHGTFDDTSVPGTYTFDAVLEWDDSRSGRLHREERLEQLVSVTPAAARTEVLTTRLSRNAVRVTVTPRDRFGNYLGPGYASQLRATMAGPGTIGPIADPDQTGTYTFDVTDLPDGGLPDVAIAIGGTGGGNPVVVHTGGSSPSGPSSPSSTAGRWRLFLDAGPNFPSGSFGNDVDGDWSLNLGLERQLSAAWSIEAVLGDHRFDSHAFSHPQLWQFTAGVKRRFGTAPLQPFVDAGLGVYVFDPGNDTRGGGYAGAGLLYSLSTRWALEGVWHFHTVRSSPSSDFSTLQAGVRFSF